MKKGAISLMCKNIEKEQVDVNKMAEIDVESTISYLHKAYDQAFMEWKSSKRKKS